MLLGGNVLIIDLSNLTSPLIKTLKFEWPTGIALSLDGKTAAITYNNKYNKIGLQIIPDISNLTSVIDLNLNSSAYIGQSVPAFSSNNNYIFVPSVDGLVIANISEFQSPDTSV